MTPSATFRKCDLSALQYSFIMSDVSCSSRSIFEQMRIGALEKEESHIHGLIFSGGKITGIISSDFHRNRRDLFPPDKRVEVKQPFFTERSDVQIHAVQGRKRSN